jgi:hypothetical protein
LVIPLKIGGLESLTEYLLSGAGEPVIPAGCIMSFSIMALFFYRACLVSLS